VNQLPEKLEAELVAEATSSTSRRKVFMNQEHGITLTVTWAPPYPDIGVQVFTCKALPLFQFKNYEALRKAWAEKHSEKSA